MVGRIDGPRFCASRIFRVIPGKDIAGAIRIPASLTKNASSTIRFLLVAMAAIRVYLLAAKRSRICSEAVGLRMDSWSIGGVSWGRFSRACGQGVGERYIGREIGKRLVAGTKCIYRTSPLHMGVRFERVGLVRTQGSGICSGEDTLSMNARMVGNTNRSVLL